MSDFEVESCRSVMRLHLGHTCGYGVSQKQPTDLIKLMVLFEVERRKTAFGEQPSKSDHRLDDGFGQLKVQSQRSIYSGSALQSLMIWEHSLPSPFLFSLENYQ